MSLSKKRLLQIITSPNFLTILRIFVAPLVLFLFLFLPQNLIGFRVLTFSLFVGVALTDLLDGYLARKNKSVSKFGICFDNIADKVLVSLTLLGLLATNRIHVIIVSLIISREIIVSGLREFVAINKIKELPVTMISKAKTTIQIVGISILLLFVKGSPMNYLGIIILIVSIFMGIITLLNNLKIVIRNIGEII